MQHRLHRVSDISKHAFENLVALWLTIVCLAFAAAFLLSATEAKAGVLLPMTELEKVYEPAVFMNFSSSPPPAQVKERCANHLHPQHQTQNAPVNLSSRYQRNADTQRLQTVMGIKAYRQCVSEEALSQLATK